MKTKHFRNKFSAPSLLLFFCASLLFLISCGPSSREWGYKPTENLFALSLPPAYDAKPQKPKAITAEPEYGARCLYAEFPYGPDGKENPYTLVLVEASEKPGSFARLYADQDRDGDIREEDAFSFQKEIGARFELSVPAKGKRNQHRLTVKISPVFSFLSALERRSNPSAATLLPTTTIHIISEGAWQGEVKVNGKPVFFTLWDNTVNGIFNDPLEASGAQLISPGDGLVVGPIEDSVLSDFDNVILLPALVETEGKLFEAGVAADGSSLAFTEAKVPVGFLEASTENFFPTFVTDQGKCVRSISPGKRKALPAGKASIIYYTATASDKFGAAWRLTGTMKNQMPITIEEGRTIALPAGPPLSLGIVYRGDGKEKPGSKVSLSCLLRDAWDRTVRVDHVHKVVPGSVNFPVIIIKQGEEIIKKLECEGGG